MCNLYSMTTNVEAIRRLFGVDAANDYTGSALHTQDGLDKSQMMLLL
jgi:hypothetical protein